MLIMMETSKIMSNISSLNNIHKIGLFGNYQDKDEEI